MCDSSSIKHDCVDICYEKAGGREEVEEEDDGRLVDRLINGCMDREIFRLTESWA